MVLYHITLHDMVIQESTLYYTILPILFYTVLDCTKIHCTILDYTLFYSTSHIMGFKLFIIWQRCYIMNVVF